MYFNPHKTQARFIVRPSRVTLAASASAFFELERRIAAAATAAATPEEAAQNSRDRRSGGKDGAGPERRRFGGEPRGMIARISSCSSFTLYINLSRLLNVYFVHWFDW